MKKRYTTSLHWTIPEKKKKKQAGGRRDGRLRIWNFQGYQRNSMWNFRADQEKIMWNFQGFWFLVLEFPRRDVTQVCTISRGGAFICLEFPGVK